MSDRSEHPLIQAYKEAGLLREGLPSTSYYPSTFQEKEGLHLLQGCSLGREEEVLFAEEGTFTVTMPANGISGQGVLSGQQFAGPTVPIVGPQVSFPRSR